MPHQQICEALRVLLRHQMAGARRDYESRACHRPGDDGYKTIADVRLIAVRDRTGQAMLNAGIKLSTLIHAGPKSMSDGEHLATCFRLAMVDG